MKFCFPVVFLCLLPPNVSDIAILSPNTVGMVITVPDHSTVFFLWTCWTVLSKLHSKS